jgi:glycosyltransferase involved in cell wall biosynthesis
MRIAFVYDALVPYCMGGAERRYHELATRLAERHEVHYVTWRYWGSAPTMVRHGVTYHGVGAPRPFYGPDGRRTVGEMVAFALRVPRLLARLDVDVVDVSGTPYLPVYAAWLATRWSRTPLVATWHEFWGDQWQAYLPDRPVVARLARLAEAAARPFADRRVAVSAFTARRMSGGTAGNWAGNAAGDPDGLPVVPNGVDLEAAAAAPDPRRSDVLFVGRLIAEKRVDLLVRAIAAVARERPRVRCLVVGDGPERPALDALLDRLGLQRNVQLLGRVGEGEVPGLMAASRVLVLPSAREGYGIAVVEAQAAGLVPIVARGEFSAATDLVRDGVDGLLVEPDPEAIAAAIADLLADAGRRRAMAAAARRSAASSGWADRAADMERIYARLVAERTGAAGAGREEDRASVLATAPVGEDAA